MSIKTSGVFVSLLAAAALSVVVVPAQAAVSLHEYGNSLEGTQSPSTEKIDINDLSHTQSVDPTLENFVPLPTDMRYNLPQPRSAWGNQTIGGFNVGIKGVSVTIPKIVLYHKVNGSGLKMTSEFAQVNPVTSIVCNYKIQFQNRYGNSIYSTTSTPLQNGCLSVFNTSSEIFNPSGKRTLKRGLQCARLFINGVYAGEQCHNIF